MDFALNDDHLALRDAVRRFCDGEYPQQQRGDVEAPAQSARRWAGMAGLGLLGLPFAADNGGSGLGPVEVMLVAEELGRALGGGAFVGSTVMAGQLLTRLGSAPQLRQWVPALADGGLQAAVALYEPGARYDWHQVQTRAEPIAQGFRLDGSKTLVLHGDSAGLLLVVARGPASPGGNDGLSVLAVDVDAAGVELRGFDTLDGRRAAHVRFTDVVVAADRLLGSPGQATSAVDAALDAATAALCAEAVGAVDALLVQTAAHLRQRKQFGVALAKFQVLQHRFADMVIGLEQLRSMACASAMALQTDETATRRRMVSAAKVLAGQLGRQIGLWAIQLHGAMGMTDECRVGHYAKRLMVIGQLFGDAAWHLERMQADRDSAAV